MYSPGDTLRERFATHDPSTTPPVLASMDTMTGALLRNGVDSGESVTVSEVATGEYLLAVEIPAEWSFGDTVQLRAYAVKGGTADVSYGWAWRLGEAVPAVSDIVVGVFGQVVEVGTDGRPDVDFGDAVALLASALAGRLMGVGTSQMTAQGVNSSATRIVATRDDAGNRATVEVTLP